MASYPAEKEARTVSPDHGSVQEKHEAVNVLSRGGGTGDGTTAGDASRPMGSDARQTVVVMSLDEAQDRIGITKFHWALLVVCALGTMSDTMQLLLITLLAAALRDFAPWSGDDDADFWIGASGAVVFAGMLLGAMWWGVVSDLYGRRFGFFVTTLVTGLAGVASAFSPTLLTLILLRFLTGFGLGGNIPIDYSLMVEFLPTKNRGTMMSLLSYASSVGDMGAAALAWAIMPTLGWRWLLGLCSLPPLLITLFRWFVPESPRWLLANGRSREALQVLRKVASWGPESQPPALPAGMRLAPLPVARNLEAEARMSKCSRACASLKSLLTLAPRLTLTIWFVWFFFAFAGYGATILLPAIFPGESQYQKVFLATTPEIPALLFATWLIHPRYGIGRRATMAVTILVCLAGTGLCLIESHQWVQVVGAMMFKASSLASSCAIYVYTSEAFFTSARTTAMGTASDFTRLAGIFVPFLDSYFVAAGLTRTALIIYMVAYGITLVGVAALPFETSGKSVDSTPGRARNSGADGGNAEVSLLRGSSGDRA